MNYSSGPPALKSWWPELSLAVLLNMIVFAMIL
jgi:hypothetical protein